jgi:ribosomal protein L11 methyltransferase
VSWIEIRAQLPTSPDNSQFIEVFRKFGIENTLEEPDVLIGALACVPGAEDRIAELTARLMADGALRITTQEVPEMNWDEVWKQHFKPRRVGDRLMVRPTWERPAAEDGILEIVLDPGQAFGTGDHPTTRMCLELMESASLDGARVCDVGCGSGILSVAACKLGAKSVLAIDIEPISVEVALQNAALNGVTIDARVGEGIGSSEEPYDVVVSNIISAILIRLARDIRAALKPDGRWIVSGIIRANWDDVLAKATRSGFDLDEIKEEDGWVAGRFSCV